VRVKRRHEILSFQHILYNKKDSIMWLTLNRPQVLNALNSGLWQELYEALDMAERDEDIRVVVITGAGRAFSAGDDIKEVASFESLSEIRNFLLNYAVPAVMKIIELPKPIIAAVNGPAYGGGCEIAMLCDLVIASENASFAIPEARIGAYPPIATTIGVYLIGKLNTSMLALTGESITAREAERIGLVNRVVSAEELRDVVNKTAEKITLSAPSSIRAIKKTLNKRFRREELEEAVIQLIALLKKEEAKEGHLAFIEKRPPKWIAKKED
jgi:enoyl-CoA hydratase/3-hydroxyacyl-CoA dehydrogenase